MRTILATLLLALSITAVCAKDWGEMNGHERRLYVTSYVVQNNLQCTYPAMSTAVQEKELAARSWIAVTIGIKMYCSQGPAAQQAVMKR